MVSGTQRIGLIGAVMALVTWVAGVRVLDRVAPTVHVSDDLQSVPVRGHVSISFWGKDEGSGLGHVSASLGGRPLSLHKMGRGWAAEIPTGAWPGGHHPLRIEVSDNAWPVNTAVIERTLEVDHTGPGLLVREDSFTANQGRTWALFVRSDEPLSSISAKGFGGDLPLYPVGPGVFRALLGVRIQSEPGPRMVRIVGTDRAGNRSERRITVQLDKTVFSHGGHIRLSRAKRRAMGEVEKRKSAQANRNGAYKTVIAEQLWSGPFQRPTTGIRTSSFGRYRTYNTGVARHHYGVDIANRSGTPVMASNGGVVTLSEFQHTFGHVVILGHGQGLSTSYNHLRERTVTEGERIRKGQQIGLMGTTGQSTGPHLHWGMEVGWNRAAGGGSVDAEQWQEHDFEGNEPVAYR